MGILGLARGSGGGAVRMLIPTATCAPAGASIVPAIPASASSAAVTMLVLMIDPPVHAEGRTVPELS